MTYSIRRFVIGFITFFSCFVFFLLLSGTSYAATATWTNGGGDGLWSTCSNWSGGTGVGGCPGTSDVATFNNTSDADSTVDATFAGSVQGIDINSGYDGTITVSRSITIGTSNFDQADGTWDGGSQTMDINSGSFTVSGGIHTATTGTWTVERDFTASGGTLTLTGATVSFDDSTFINNDSTLTCTGTFGGTVNVVKDSSASNDFTLASGCTVTTATFDVMGDTTINGTANGTNMTLEQDLTVGASGVVSMSGSVTFDDVTFLDNDSVLTCTGTLGSTVNVVKDSSVNNDFTLASGCTVTTATFDVMGSTIINGTANGTNMTLEQNLTVGASGVVSMSGSVTFDDSISSNNDSTLTCTGTLGSTVNVVKDSSANNDFTLGLGCTTTFSTFDVMGDTTINGTANGTNMTLEQDLTVGASGVVSMSGSVTFDDTTFLSNDSILSCTGTFGSTVTVTKDSSSNNDFTLGLGCTVSSATINLLGNITVNGTISSGSVSINDTGSSQDSTLTCGGSSSMVGASLTFVKDFTATNDITLVGNCSVGDFTRTDGVVNNPASAAILTVAGNFSMSTSDAFGGANLTLNMVPSTGTKTITQNAGTMSGLFNVTTSGGAGVQLATNFTTGSTCNLVEGTFDINGSTFSCGSTYTVEDGGIFELYGVETTTTPTLNPGSTVKYTGNGNSSATAYTLKDYDYHHLTVASTDSIDTFATPNATEDANGTFTLSGGVFTAPSGDFTIGGNFAHSGGTFTHNSGTVVLDGSSQQVSGSTTFNNLTKETASTNTLTFVAGTTQTVEGTLTLNGASSNLLSLRSSSEDTQWDINPQGTRTISYLDVQDSNNTNGTVINAVGTNSVSSGGNTNWNFTTPSAPSSLGPSGLTDGSETSETQPELTFTLSDTDSEDDVRYRIQIDNDSDFSSPTVDYTSALSAQGTKTFTVGQAEGTGTYAEGMEGQELADSSYYWRVKTIDEYGAESSYTTANSGSVAFIVDTTTPTPAPSSGSSSSSTAAFPPGCSNTPPTSSPELFRLDRRATSITMFFNTSTGSVDSYVIAYGLIQDANNFGTNFEFSGTPGVLQYSINDLSPNTTYYFKIRAGNGCATGDWSETLSARTLGGFVSLTPAEEKEVERTVQKRLPNATEEEQEQETKQIVKKLLEDKNGERKDVETTNIKINTSFFTNVVNAIKNFAYGIISPIKTALENSSNRFGKNIAATMEVWFDTEPTIITDVMAEEIGPDYMVISWKTNHFATSKVNYGTTYDYGQDLQTIEKTREHRLKITGLKRDTTYYYEVMSQGKNYVFDARHEVKTKK